VSALGFYFPHIMLRQEVLYFRENIRKNMRFFLCQWCPTVTVHTAAALTGVQIADKVFFNHVITHQHLAYCDHSKNFILDSNVEITNSKVKIPKSGFQIPNSDGRNQSICGSKVQISWGNSKELNSKSRGVENQIPGLKSEIQLPNPRKFYMLM
jgi:hypothetical protein